MIKSRILNHANVGNRLKSLELFAGAGGMALGIHDAGFEQIALIEKNTFAAETLRENSRHVLQIDPTLILHCDAESVDYSGYLGKVDLLAGGPPCQPFSTAGKAKGQNDTRNMFPVFLDAVAAIRPKAILLENVKGLLRSNFKDYFEYVRLRLQFPLCCIEEREEWTDHRLRLLAVKETEYDVCEQYLVTFQLVDAADYGVPQCRERVIITAFRKDLGIQPIHLPPTHSKEALLIDQWITGDYWKTHGVESYDYLTGKDKSVLALIKKNPVLFEEREPWLTVRYAIGDLPEPVQRGEEPKFSNHIQHPGARVYPNHIGSYLDYPAKALKAGTHGTPGGENMIRFSNGEVRYFTTRETARLQNFPDAWHFHGSWGSCIRQLGNAVPVKLAHIFARSIHDRLTTTNAQPSIEETNERPTVDRQYATSNDSTGTRRNQISPVAMHS